MIEEKQKAHKRWFHSGITEYNIKYTPAITKKRD
jgi:hypothetical protein